MDERFRKIDPGLPERLGGNLKTLEKVYSSSFAILKETDLSVIQVNCGARLSGGKVIIIKYFSRDIIVNITEEKLVYHYNGREADMFTAVLVLHYIITADGEPMSGKWISYRELPEGMFYFRTIPGVLEPLLSRYMDSFAALLQKVREFGGSRSKELKNGAVIYPFPYFPVMLVMEERTEEFEPELRVLFDSSASHYMKTDIIKVLLVNIVKLLTG